MLNKTIEAKVKARNRANTFVLMAAPQIFAAIEPFVGSKVINADGSFSAKFKKVLPTMPNTASISARFTQGHGYSFKLAVKTSEMQDSYSCVYSEVDLYIAHLTDGVITGLYETPKANDFRTDFTVAEAQNLEHSITAAESALSTLRSKLSAIIG